MDLDKSYENKNNELRCLRLNQNIQKPLNITYNPSISKLLFWNKFQLFIYNINSINDVKHFVPEFHIKDVLICNNYLVSLDVCGNMHITSLKFKNSTQTKLKIIFQPKAQNVLAIRLHNENSILVLRNDNNSYNVSINKVNTEMNLESEAVLNLSDETLTEKSDELIFYCQIVSLQKHKYLSNLFNIKAQEKECVLIFISLERQTIWYSLMYSGMPEENIKLVKLYTCPSSICNIKMIESDSLNLIIGLEVGSIIKIPLDTKKPVLEHLNIALYKFDLSSEGFYYTDGDAMWHCKELFTASKGFNEIFVHNVYCFMKYETQMAVTTFDNLVYLFPLDRESNYIHIENKDDYYPAEKVLNNSHYLGNILNVLDQNKVIVQKLNEEKNYLLAISLSNRADIMNKMISTSLQLYYNYEDAIKDNSEKILLETLTKYFEENVVILAIKFDSCNLNQFFSELISYLKYMKIHISFHRCNKILQIHSVTIQKLQNVTYLLLPLNIDKINDKISIKIKFVTEVPSGLNKENKICCVLYSNSMVLKSEQFLNIEQIKKPICLKNPQKNIEILIQESAYKLYGNLFKLKKIDNKVSHTWTSYINLLNNYEIILKSDDIFANVINKKLATYLSLQIKNEMFLKCRRTVTLNLSGIKATIAFYKDEFRDSFKLKICSEDISVTQNLRNYFAKEFHRNLTDADYLFINADLYTTTENIRKALQDWVCSSSQGKFLSIIEEFNKDVIGALNI